nr:immunoglobulin heavy chain junction region [Mus musculus]NSM04620.1 immunoglobulin heavy chain junction region [Mus musculus]NSM04799.1 immunoglobulin heavy chain junction region [Mus musculus]NSM05699.1 immunoglobulin heavy chain junction region [Mus musculus]NSM05919.1 immunoglobulin heavy chain junction region [Mus musculus]
CARSGYDYAMDYW